MGYTVRVKDKIHKVEFSNDKKKVRLMGVQPSNWYEITSEFVTDPQKFVSKILIGEELLLGSYYSNIEKISNSEGTEDFIFSLSTERFLEMMKEVYEGCIGQRMKPAWKNLFESKISTGKPDFTSEEAYFQFIFLPNTNFHDTKFLDKDVNQNTLIFERNYPYKKMLNLDVFFNNQFRWQCLMAFVVSHKTQRTSTPYNIWNMVETPSREGIIYVDELPDVYYVRPGIFGTRSQAEFSSYNEGGHLRDSKWRNFFNNSRFDKFLPIVQKKRICKVGLKETVIEEIQTSIIDYHYSYQVRFSDIFTTIYDGFTKKHWTIFEISVSAIMILSDMVLTSDFDFEEPEGQENKMIYNTLKDIPLRERSWSRLKDTGIQLNSMVHFSLSHYKNRNPGAFVMESLYWAVLGIVEKGYYTMNKIYSEEHKYSKEEDLLPSNYEFRLGNVSSREDVIYDLFGKKLGTQIWGLYSYLQTTPIKKFSSLNYEIWRLIPVEELEK